MMLLLNVSLSLIKWTEWAFFSSFLRTDFFYNLCFVQKSYHRKMTVQLPEHNRHRRQVCGLHWMHHPGLWNWHVFYKSSKTTRMRLMQFWKLWEEKTISSVVTTSYRAEYLDLWNAFYKGSHIIQALHLFSFFKILHI